MLLMTFRRGVQSRVTDITNSVVPAAVNATMACLQCSHDCSGATGMGSATFGGPSAGGRGRGPRPPPGQPNFLMGGSVGRGRGGEGRGGARGGGRGRGRGTSPGRGFGLVPVHILCGCSLAITPGSAVLMHLKSVTPPDLASCRTALVSYTANKSGGYQ